MANKLRGEIDITFGGQTYTMRANFSFIATVEASLNMPILEIWSKASTSQLPIKDMVAIIQAGMREAGSTMSAAKIGEALLAEEGGPANFYVPVAQLLQLCFQGHRATVAGEDPQEAEAQKT